MNDNETKIYEDATWGNKGKDIVPSRFYQVYKIEGPIFKDDEGIWYDFNSKDKSTVSLSPEYENFEFNKFGLTESMEELEVTITPNENLKNKYPNAIVNIDGKFYDLGILNNPLKLFMSKDHKVSILWEEGLVESYRFICLK